MSERETFASILRPEASDSSALRRSSASSRRDFSPQDSAPWVLPWWVVPAAAADAIPFLIQPEEIRRGPPPVGLHLRRLSPPAAFW